MTETLLHAAPGQASTPDERLLVNTTGGVLRGYASGTTERFMAIPYAAPPVGPLRWAPPQPAARWEGVRDAIKPPPVCAGQVASDINAFDEASEDCLYLNVIRPAESGPERPLPVMVWIHGGGFVMGNGAVYDPAPLVATGEVIVVTINYRLGIFGFFAYPGLEGAGSYGLLDQQAALRWVRDNIAAFGGDPAQVTLFGESAGGISTCAQLCSPDAAGLFGKAIIQSGPATMIWPRNTLYAGCPETNLSTPLAAAEQVSRDIAARLGCEGPNAVEKLRALPVDAFQGMHGSVGRICHGTPTLPEEPAVLAREGRMRAMPILHGMTRDEMTSFVGMMDGPHDAEEYVALTERSFGEHAASVLSIYPADRHPSAQRSWAAVATDSSFARAAVEFNDAMSETAPLWAYEFADHTAPNVGFVGPEGYDFGASHAYELKYLFDLGSQPADFTPEQSELSQRMVRHWVAFATQADPALPDEPWPAYTRAHPHVEVFGGEDRDPLGFARRHHVDLWATIHASR